MANETVYDIAIIGGGLAGLALAIQSADIGYKTILFEKETYPYHKVCGEYISNESLSFIRSLGFPFDEYKLPTINQLILTNVKGNKFSFPLPLGGFGISRYTLDNRLYNQAQKKGASILTNTKVNNVQFANDIFNVHAENNIIQARVVVGSFGKKSNLDVLWKRNFTTQKPDAKNNYIGVKYHLRFPHPSNEIVLHNFKDGYCGMSKIEDDKSCLCYLTTAENLKKSGNSIKEMEQKILWENPKLREIFDEAIFLYDQPLVISQINFSKKKQIENHVLLLGDSAGLISPLCGNGMSMALHSSKIAFQQIQLYLQSKITRMEMEEKFTSLWEKEFSKRLWIGRNVQSLFGKNSTTSIFLKAMNHLPFVANKLIEATHGRNF